MELHSEVRVVSIQHSHRNTVSLEDVVIRAHRHSKRLRRQRVHTNSGDRCTCDRTLATCTAVPIEILEPIAKAFTSLESIVDPLALTLP